MSYSIINSLASGLTTTCDRKALKSLLESTGGWMMVQGYGCDIRSKHLGVGVYKVWAEKQK
jgi:hypothetical protein